MSDGEQVLRCEFCGREDFTRPQGLGAHRARCEQNPDRKSWGKKKTKVQKQVQRQVQRQDACATIPVLRAQLIEALEAEIGRLQSELELLKSLRPE